MGENSSARADPSLCSASLLHGNANVHRQENRRARDLLSAYQGEMGGGKSENTCHLPDREDFTLNFSVSTKADIVT